MINFTQSAIDLVIRPGNIPVILVHSCVILLYCCYQGDVEMEDSTPRLLEKADPAKQESLDSENVPDPMEGEQTWPTEEELAEAEGR